MPRGHKVEGGYTKEVSCDRCRGIRWVRVDVLEPYKCQRCRRFLEGRPADDPLHGAATRVLTPEQRQAAGERLRRAKEAKRRGPREATGDGDRRLL